jgi:hypothetical protein
MSIEILPKCVGMHEKQRSDGTYGYVCNLCGYPVRDGDGYCSECGARVGGTLFYLGKTYSRCKHDACFPCYRSDCSEYVFIGKYYE